MGAPLIKCFLDGDSGGSVSIIVCGSVEDLDILRCRVIYAWDGSLILFVSRILSPATGNFRDYMNITFTK